MQTNKLDQKLAKKLKYNNSNNNSKIKNNKNNLKINKIMMNSTFNKLLQKKEIKLIFRKKIKYLPLILKFKNSKIFLVITTKNKIKNFKNKV